MRAAILLAACGLVFAQVSDPSYEPLSRAYEALRERDYDSAIGFFLKGVAAAPERASARKDLAYTYLKIGENTLARDQFREAMRIDPSDTQVAMEVAYLCYETKERQEARRIFDRVRRSGQAPFAAAAAQAFRNIDEPLGAGIERWKQAIAMGADNFSAHFELATLAEERDELDLAAAHYERAWRLLPEHRSVLVALGALWKALGRTEDANAALLAASRGGEPRAAEAARALLPERYPYVPEFRRAIELDPSNDELRRELGFLLLKMESVPEGETEFQSLTADFPSDLLSATQLGFLLYADGRTEAARPLFDRVLAGGDPDLANRVRAVLRLPQEPAAEPAKPAAVDAREMGERSVRAGYMKDAVKYFLAAHDADPGDFGVMLRLGWTYNILRLDADAMRWFGMAAKSPDPRLAREAAAAYGNLRPYVARFRVTTWMFPTYSSRWSDLFGYGQSKIEMRTRFPLRPYVSLRFIGDARRRTGDLVPRYLSESSFVPAVGISTPTWHGAVGWAEAGIGANYLTGHVLQDYRAGAHYGRSLGRPADSEAPAWFAETNTDAVFISRFANDLIVYEQARAGVAHGWKGLRGQLYWNGNLTFDARRQAWANFWESGPGVRVFGSPLPKGAYVTFDVLRGAYRVGSRTWFSDIRAGVWYAFTR